MLLLDLLRQVGESIDLDAEVTLVGGSAGMLTAELPATRTTVDCDVIYTEPQGRFSAVRDAAAKLAQRLGLPEDWLNDQVAQLDVLPSGWRRRRIDVGTFGRLRVWCVGRIDLLAMKVYAGRLQDRADVLDMKPKPEEIGFVRKYLDQFRIPSRQADLDQIVRLSFPRRFRRADPMTDPGFDLLANWSRLGILWNVPAVHHTPDVELLIVRSLAPIRRNPRMLVLLSSWISVYWRCVGRDRLSQMASAASDEEQSTLAIMLEATDTWLSVPVFAGVVRHLPIMVPPGRCLRLNASVRPWRASLNWRQARSPDTGGSGACRSSAS